MPDPTKMIISLDEDDLRARIGAASPHPAHRARMLGALDELKRVMGGLHLPCTISEAPAAPKPEPEPDPKDKPKRRRSRKSSESDEG